jgi:hypothetical protein
MTPWTSVVSYHTDPETCGVAKFSAQLAARLGVELLDYTERFAWGARPLLSVKFGEYCSRVDAHHDQLWHDEPPPDYTPRTNHVWKLYELGVPALVEDPVMAPDALFTFGMAHKPDLARFTRLAQVFADTRQLWISTAVHEGAGPSRVQGLMQVWGPHARNLGHLSDAALQLIWPRCFAFVAFFEKGLRANNSSVHAALNAGVTVITNHGPSTPADLRVHTIDQDDILSWSWPRPTGSPYTWDRLLKELTNGPQP